MDEEKLQKIKQDIDELIRITSHTTGHPRRKARIIAGSAHAKLLEIKDQLDDLDRK